MATSAAPNPKNKYHYELCYRPVSIVGSVKVEGDFSVSNARLDTEILQQTIQEVQQTPEEYLPSLLQTIRIFRESVTLKPVEESFRQGWEEAMTGKTIPVSELWNGMDAEGDISTGTINRIVSKFEAS